MINESIVHVRASVKISSDGPEISSITLIDYAVTDKPKPEVPQWPREFNIDPCKIEMDPESRVSLKVSRVSYEYRLVRIVKSTWCPDEVIRLPASN